MTRPNSTIIVSVIALLIAGGASLLANNYLKKHSGSQSQGVAVAVASTEIPVGTRLSATHFKLAAWPKEALVQGYQNDVKKLTGRVAVRPMSAGDIVTEAKLLPQAGSPAGGIMTYMVPQGHRAVTVAVNEVAGVAGFITPGCKVDVVLTTPKPGATTHTENISKIILQNVPVLASGQGTEQKEGKPVLVQTVTLDLTPADAEMLIVGGGVNKGALQLLLRNAVDVAAVDTKGATVAKALNGVGTPVATRVRRVSVVRLVRSIPAAPPLQAKLSVEIIKGGLKSSKEFAVEN